MDQELRTFLQEQFQEIRQRFETAEGQIGGLREEVGGLREEVGGLREEVGGLREESQEGIRHTHVLLEDVQSTVRLLAEGVAGVTERMDRLEHDLHKKLDEQWSMVVNPIRDLHHRVTHLEEVENRRTRDIIEVIRERYGIRRDA